MKETFIAPAKLNLYLRVVGKKEDGYHLIESIMQTINLVDEVTLKLTKSNINITCSNSNIPCDENNIAYKCAMEFFRYTNIKCGVDIDIKKNIPSGAGMGGGSADGAIVIQGLNKLLSSNLSIEDMIKIGVKVGADIPYLLVGGTAKVYGIGETIEKINSIPKSYFVIIKPNFSISTKEAYLKIDEIKLNQKVDINNIISAIHKENLYDISKYLYNDFELVAPNTVFYIKQKLKELGALNSLMTGSGSAIFGIFEDEDTAIFAKEVLSREYENVYIANNF